MLSAHFASIKYLLLENYSNLRISETWLTNDITNEQFETAGNSFLWFDRWTRGGGVGIYTNYGPVRTFGAVVGEV